MEEESQLFHARANMSELEMEKIFQQEIQKKVNPNLYWKKALQNAFLLWYVPAKYFYDHNWKTTIPRKIFVIFLNLLTVLSTIYFYKKNNC